MNIEPTSTARSRRLRERLSRGIAMVAPVEVGEGGIALLVGNGLLKQHWPAWIRWSSRYERVWPVWSPCCGDRSV